MGEKEIRTLVNEYIDRLNKYFKLRSVILYGSYAKNTAHPDSDIDLAIVVDKEEKEMDYLQERALLYKMLRGMDYHIEPVLIYYDDFINSDKFSFYADIKNSWKSFI